MNPGDVLEGRFQIERRVKGGGMGDIFVALDRQTGERVAVKTMRASDDQNSARFRREAAALAAIEHPDIVRYVAHGFAPGGEPYLAMAWLEGEDLRQRLLRGRMRAADAVGMCRRIAAALAEVHVRGVVHRDLKPSNIFLIEGDIARPRVIDFGVAQLASATPLTRSGQFLGTPGYMSPEQARGETRLSPRADVFALGCILFECLTGTPAYRGGHVLALLGKILWDPIPRVTERWPGIHPELDALVARLMAREPGERPEDGAAVVRALDAIAPALSGPALVPVRDELEPRVPVTGLTRAEQRLRAVILLGAEDSRLTASTLAREELEPATPELRAWTAAHGGRLEPLADGSMAITFASPEVATDLAAQVARCALALRPLLPTRRIAVSVWRGRTGDELGFGEGLERAATLLRAGPLSHEIFVSELLAALLGGRFDVVRGPLGIVLRGEHEVPDMPTRLLLGRPSPFVGRERELALLAGLLDECIEDRSARAMLVTAPAGLGKSRLVHELLRSLARRGVEVAVWTASGAPLQAGSALGLLAQALRRACGVREGDPPATQREHLAGNVARRLPPAAAGRVTEFLGELLGVPPTEEASAALRAARQDAHLMTEQMQRAWEELLCAETSARPVLIVLEDLHWGDHATVRFLDAALRDHAQRPWMILALARPEVHDRLPKLWDARPMQVLRLLPLSARASAKMAERALGGRAEQALVERVAALCEGNAFYLEELIRAVAGGRHTALPETVLAMAEARLDGLSPEVRRLLRAASVLGDVFWDGALASLLGGPERLGAVRGALRELVEQEVIVRRRDSRFAGAQEYAFRHALLREGAYATLTADDRIWGHRLALDWLEAHGEPIPLVLAHHAELGAAPERAARHYLRAAEQALRGGDPDAAIEHAGRGLRGAGSDDLRTALHSVLCDGHSARMEFLTAVETAEEGLKSATPGSFVWAKAAAARIAAAAYSFADPDSLYTWIDALVKAEPEPDAVGPVAYALYMGSYCACRKARFAPAGASLERLRTILAPLGDRDPVARGFYESLAAVYMPFAEADPFGGLDWSRRAEASLTEVCMWQEALLARAYAGMNLWMLGAFAEAEQTLRSTTGVPGDTTMVLIVRAGILALVLTDREQHAEALAEATELIDVARAGSLTQDEGIGRAALADIYRRSGDLAAAEHEALAADALLVDVPLDRIANVATLAAIRLARGEVPAALDDAARAVAHYDATGSAYRAAFARLVHARCLAAAGRQDAAREALADARARVLANAAKIADPGYRSSFLAEVPEHRETLELARAWLGPLGERDAR